MLFVLSVLVFFGGATIASALLTWFWRFKHNKKWTSGRSMCDVCGRTLPISTLIPVIGRLLVPTCPECKNSAPWYSFTAEILVGLAWLSIFLWNYALPSINWPWLAFQFTLATALIIVAVVDFYWQEIPVFLLSILTVLALIFLFLSAQSEITWTSRFLGAGASAGFFLWQYVLSRGRWIGSGDIWVGAFLGLVFGWNAIVLVLAVGYGLGAVASIMQLTIFQKKIPRTIPLGGWLCVSGIIFFIIKIV